MNKLFLSAIMMASPMMVKAANPLDALRNHENKMFKKDIIKVTDGVYVAVGYSTATSSMIIGEDGIIIIDTTQGTGTAEDILAEFRKITDKPIKAIVYTHGHPDHICGAKVFVAEGSNPEIFARTNLFNELDDKHLNRTGPFKILQKRLIRQYGIRVLKPHTEKISDGIGPAELNSKGMNKGFVPPTRTFSGDKMGLTSAGIKLELYKAPGETDDQLFVWMPEKKVLFCGDNFYQTFPNLYAIRGTVYRDFNLWADSLDLMTQFPVVHLVPGHTRPISGDKAIEALSDYRDAIRYIISKTAEGMNKGLIPDELVEYVKLPEHLAGKYYLQEFFGTVAWSVRAYFSGTIGWFDGNPSNLFPTPPVERARRIADLAGGEAALYAKLQKAAEAKEHQWVSELADTVALLGSHKKEAQALKAQALIALADQQSSAIARNYYLAFAKELKAELEAKQ